MKKNLKKGFTLVELLVVIAILAILATVSVVGYTAFITKARESVAMQELTQLRDYIVAEDLADVTWSVEEDLETKLAALLVASGLEGAASYANGVVTYTIKGREAAAQWTISSNEIARADVPAAPAA